MGTTVKARIQLKHDTEEHWSRAVNFCPMKGQPIIYDADPDNGQPFPRLKVGDGTTPVVDLPFLTSHTLDKETQYNTTEYWNALANYIPDQGKIIIYSNKYINGNNVYPAIKIGDGSTYLVDLPFLDDLVYQNFNNHINNTDIHVSAADRIFWNNKINCQDTVQDETLELMRR